MQNFFKSRIDEINLNAGNAIVIGSGILEVLGIRDSGDIDIVVSNDIFENIETGVLNHLQTNNNNTNINLSKEPDIVNTLSFNLSSEL